MEVKKTCQNCDFECHCNHSVTGICEDWRPDLDYKREAKHEEAD